MSIYYEDEFVTLYHGDCLEVLPTLAAGSVHACITDPPYILQAGSSSTRGSKTGGWADMMNASFFYSQWYREVDRTLKHTGSLWTFGNWRSIPVMMRAAIDAELPTTSLLVWDKKWIGPGGPQQLRSQHEVCMVMAKPGFEQPNRSQGDVLQVPASSHKPTGHPAEKPEALMEKIVEFANVPAGGMILDPFAGSGTTLVAAAKQGFHVIGVEAEERWCEIAANRLSQGVLPLWEGGAA